jgi:hypothetical protein
MNGSNHMTINHLRSYLFVQQSLLFVLKSQMRSKVHLNFVSLWDIVWVLLIFKAKIISLVLTIQKYFRHLRKMMKNMLNTRMLTKALIRTFNPTIKMTKQFRCQLLGTI